MRLQLTILLLALAVAVLALWVILNSLSGLSDTTDAIFGAVAGACAVIVAVANLERRP